MTAPATAKPDADSLAVASATEHLRFAVSDQQETIRGTDLKAEVLGILITGLLAIASWKGDVTVSTANGWLGVIAVLATLLALLFVGAVLWPLADPWRGLNLGGYKPSRVLYPSAGADPQRDVPALAKEALATDWICELTYELAKLSLIRDTKRRSLRGALMASGVAILAVAVRLFVPVVVQVSK